MLIIIIIFFLAIYLGYCYNKAYVLAYQLSHPRRCPGSLNRDIPIIYKKFDITAKDGIILKGIEIQPKVKAKGTILVCHYLGGSMSMTLSFADCLLREGFSVVSFDFRNHGESQDDPKIKFHLEEDFYSFFEQLKANGIEGPFGIYGLSMGSTSALFGLSKYNEIKAAVIDSGPLILVKEYFLYVLDEKKVKNPIMRQCFLFIYLQIAGFKEMSKKSYKILKHMEDKPMLLIHGEKDNIINIQNAEIVKKRSNSSKTALWSVANSRHLTSRFLKKLEYELLIIEFFNKNLLNGVNDDEEDCIYIS